MTTREEIRPAADSMLGSLAKWLRLLGFDTVYLRRGPGSPLPGRVLLTRRSSRPHQPVLSGWPRIIHITAGKTMLQLAEFIREAGITKEDLRPLTRCSVCNHALRQAGLEEAAPLVPEFVGRTHKEFSLCPGCGRVYWPGTHAGRVRQMIEEAFASQDFSGPGSR